MCCNFSWPTLTNAPTIRLTEPRHFRPLSPFTKSMVRTLCTFPMVTEFPKKKCGRPRCTPKGVTASVIGPFGRFAGCTKTQPLDARFCFKSVSVCYESVLHRATTPLLLQATGACLEVCLQLSLSSFLTPANDTCFQKQPDLC